ncbi:alkaline phosphatase family protein [Haloechinothrix sp. YIM 98757]|uniref:Alkaline phosphatase family protein n=1 Tax=Haloechinothrix aidingensis TaxID=2752311 RepID=A0A838ACZ2_9PSEU|nr:alkaline phosphatase D family protein [Haloechinothrix aidingensis]MBA0127149.1 alkaline phosphatase family protein [Haloechinothrix aidingensis]
MAQAHLVLGPILRYADTTSATVWLETDRSCTVEVAGASAPTFCIGGHHYALVVVTGLAPGTSIPYDVRLDGTRVWPEHDSRYPHSRIRTHSRDQGSAMRLLFGSCRYAADRDARGRRTLGADALDAYAVRMGGMPEPDWPDALLLLGDQVYADETSARIRQLIRARRDTARPPGVEVAEFEEYTWLYQETWTDPDIRWLLSTVPTAMIFDDHDVHDDWNTSRAWRQRMARHPWWARRECDALVSYWVYQHLGNLAPDELAADSVYGQVRSVGRTGDAIEVLRRFAEHAETEVDGVKPVRFSYCRDFGSVRLVVVDTRCGRILDGRRQMISDSDFDWLGDTTRGDYQHLVVGSALPWLMPHAIHHIESANERACDRRGYRGLLAERVRQAFDLEHWPAFRQSFDRLAELIGAIARGEHTGRPPATVSVLSGDVHHSYAAEAHFPDRGSGRVWQLTCSPVHNSVPAVVRLAFRIAWSSVATAVTRRLARLRGTAPVPLRWTKTAGPLFRNQLACLVIDGTGAHVTFHPAEPSAHTLTVSLTGSGRSATASATRSRPACRPG